jgi:hypothetical protein
VIQSIHLARLENAPTERDFAVLKTDPVFTGFLQAIGLVYKL